MPDTDTQTVHGCLKTGGDQPDYAVLYGDELARAGEGDGTEDDAVTECKIRNEENTRILISYSQNGLRAVSAYPAAEPDDETTYEPAADQPESGTRWVPEDGDHPEIRILPETEVPAYTSHDAIIRVRLNAMESEAAKWVAEDVMGLETRYDDGYVIEVGDRETQRELEERIYEKARDRGDDGDFEGAQWYKDAAHKISDADLEVPA